MDFIALAQQCAPRVAPQTMAAVVRVESSFNPYAIGVVGGALARQPRNLSEAVATAKALEQDGWNFSVGIAQVNRHNLPKHGLDYTRAFEPCANIRAGAKILEDCFVRATNSMHEQQALRAAFSCYYSGNFSRGFRPDRPGTPSYVHKVLQSSGFQGMSTKSIRVSASQLHTTSQKPIPPAHTAALLVADDQGATQTTDDPAAVDGAAQNAMVYQ